MFKRFKQRKANKKTVNNSKLNMSEWFLINEIKENPNTTVFKISNKYNLVYQQVKRVMDKLKDKKLIIVTQNPKNKRENFLIIKEKKPLS